MITRENKQSICNALCEALQLTRGYFDLDELIYDEETETVDAVYLGRKITINVAMDSGAAMIRDIMRGLRDAEN